MSEQNYGFICEICGETDLVMSSLKLSCNYGSNYDGTDLTLSICGNCADRFYKYILEIKERE